MKTTSLAAVLFVSGSMVWAQSAEPGPQFGMMGVAEHQTVRLNLVAVPPGPCSATIGFADINGNPVGPAAKTVNLSPGQADLLDATGLETHFGQRVQVHPLVTLMPGTTPEACIATAEVFGNSIPVGTVSIPGGSPSIPPGPPDFGMLGVTNGQIVRLNVAAGDPTLLCIASLGYADSNGNPAGPPALNVNLKSGQAAYLDASGLVSKAGQRVEFRPVVTLNPLTPSACQATAEVWDQITGRTSFLTPPGLPVAPAP